MANILRGLDIAAGNAAGVLQEAYRQRLAQKQAQAQNALELQKQQHELLVDKRSQIFQERMTKEKELGEQNRFNQKLAEERRQFDINAGLDKKRLELLKNQNDLQKRIGAKEEFMSQYRLYGNDLEILNNQLRTLLSENFPNREQVGIVLEKIKEKEQAMNQFGKTQGARVGFIVPEVSVMDKIDAAQEMINRRMQIAGPETQDLPFNVQRRLAQQKVMFGDSAATPRQTQVPQARPNLSDIFNSKTPVKEVDTVAEVYKKWTDDRLILKAIRQQDTKATKELFRRGYRFNNKTRKFEKTG